MDDKELDRLLAPLGLEAPPPARRDQVRAAIRRNTEEARRRLDGAAEDADTAAVRERLEEALATEAVPAGLQARVRERLRQASAAAAAGNDFIEPVPAHLKARVQEQVAQASARARQSAVVRRRQRYGAFALAASLVLGVAVALLIQRDPDLTGISTLGGGGRVDPAVRERICTLARTGKIRAAQDAFDKEVRRGGKPVTALEVDAFCRE